MVYEKLLTSEWKDNLVNETNKVITKEYTKYKSFYEFIIKFIKQNKCLISNLELLDNNDILYNKPLQIFVLNPNEISTKIFKDLCKKFGRFFVLKIEVSDKHYSIDYIAKTYIRISYINQYKNVSLIDYLSPVKVDNFLILPPILELIDLYKKIYNPEYAEEWVQLIESAKKIKKLTDINIKNSIKEFKGGNDKNIKKDQNVFNLIRKLTIEFLQQYPDYILIHKPDNNIYSIISKNTINTDFERFNKFISSNNTYNLSFRKKNIFIAKDNRIKKHTFFISITKLNNFVNKERPFLDIYNNTSYELIPYVNFNNMKLVYPWVEIRFYYIGIWNILAAFQIKSIDYNKFAQLTNTILKNIEEFEIDWEIPPKEFIGTYINEYNSYKKLMLKHSFNPRLYC